MLTITFGEMKRKVMEAFTYFVHRTWKIALPIVLLLTYSLSWEFENSLAFVYFMMIVFMGLKGVLAPLYIAFKSSSMLDEFYKEPKQKKAGKRFFVILLCSIFLMIVFAGSIVLELYFLQRMMLHNNHSSMFPFIQLSIMAVVLIIWMLTLFLSLTPMIYWGNDELTLLESIKYSLSGVKKYFFKILVFVILLPFLALFFVLAIFMFLYFSLSAEIMWYVENFAELILAWLFFSYASSVYYLFGKLALGKNDIFLEGEEK